MPERHQSGPDTIPDPQLQLTHVRGFIVDLDGTTYIDSELVDGALEFFAELTRRAIPHLFLSNNSSRSGSEYLDRLHTLGISATRDQVMTSGDATIQYLCRRTTLCKPYVIGTDDYIADFHATDLDTQSADPDCVVAAFDTSFTYAKLKRACALLFAGVPFYATHPDKTCITTQGLIPDIAAIIAACKAVTGREPIIIGKPEKPIVELALEKLGTQPSETAIIGDQLDTDMAMGQRSNLLTCLVMSGETSQEKLAQLDCSQHPDIVADNLGELSRLL